jgi:hypothetical protein
MPWGDFGLACERVVRQEVSSRSLQNYARVKMTGRVM